MKRFAFLVAAFVVSGVASQALAEGAGASCASAITLASDSTYISDTTQTTNWMFTFGPLISDSNDELYKFTAGNGLFGEITPTASNYLFAMYLIPSCSDGGGEPAPIRATATVGVGISISNLTDGAVYYVAVTGTAAGGASANGTLNFNTPFPVTLQTFTVD